MPARISATVAVVVGLRPSSTNLSPTRRRLAALLNRRTSASAFSCTEYILPRYGDSRPFDLGDSDQFARGLTVDGTLTLRSGLGYTTLVRMLGMGAFRDSLCAQQACFQSRTTTRHEFRETTQGDNPMVELIADVPDNTIAIRAEGKVTGHDYEKVIIPLIEEKLGRHEKLRALYHCGPEMEGFDAAAVWDDAKVGLKHLTA